MSNTRGWNAPSLLPSQHRKVTQLNSPLDFKMPSQDLVVSLHSSLYWDCAEGWIADNDRTENDLSAQLPVSGGSGLSMTMIS